MNFNLISKRKKQIVFFLFQWENQMPSNSKKNGTSFVMCSSTARAVAIHSAQPIKLYGGKRWGDRVFPTGNIFFCFLRSTRWRLCHRFLHPYLRRICALSICILHSNKTLKLSARLAHAADANKLNRKRTWWQRRQRKHTWRCCPVPSLTICQTAKQKKNKTQILNYISARFAFYVCEFSVNENEMK